MKRKGFTLIELLAVIVILAIIALIAVPMIINIIDDARKGAAVASARSYIKATETYIVSSELDKDKIELISNNKYNVTATTIIDGETYQSINDLVEIKGSRPYGSEDYIRTDENNQIEESLLTINGYVILIRYDEVISITKGSIISVESISLDKINEKLLIGKTLQLTATITPINAINKTVIWASSDESIAKVDSNGLVTGVNKGEATITVKTANGKEAISKITVKTIEVKADILSFDITNTDNKDITFYLNYIGNNKPTCKVGDDVITNTNDLTNLGLLGDYKINCSLNNETVTFNLNMKKLYLYKDGNEFTSITDGWLNHTTYYMPERGAFVNNNNDVLNFHAENRAGILIETKVIDANKYKTYHVNYKKLIIPSTVNNNTSSAMYSISTLSGHLPSWTESGFNNVIINSTSTNEGLAPGTYDNKTLDLKIENDSKIFAIVANSCDINTKCANVIDFQVDKIWLER